MKKKPPAKRKPSLDSIYRRVLALHTTLLNQMALIRLDIVTEREADRAILRTVTDHCARLLKEKETLHRMVEKKGHTVTEAEKDSWTRGKRVTITSPNACAVAHLHRHNVWCSVCQQYGEVGL
jgi:hypothetical protein